jgi:hypothetical protein
MLAAGIGHSDASALRIIGLLPALLIEHGLDHDTARLCRASVNLCWVMMHSAKVVSLSSEV